MSNSGWTPERRLEIVEKLGSDIQYLVKSKDWVLEREHLWDIAGVAAVVAGMPSCLLEDNREQILEVFKAKVAEESND